MVDSRTEWGALGTISFKADESPAAMRVKEATEWVEMPRIDAKALLQNVGHKLTEIDLSFTFSAGWCNPEQQLQRLRTAMLERQPMFLAWGGYDGYYVVKDVSSVVRDTLPTGEVLHMGVTVSLLETMDRPTPIIVDAVLPFLTVRDGG